MRRILVTLCLISACAARAEAQDFGALREMSIDQLENLDISSVTKTVQPLSAAPAAIYVITHDEIVRSGAQTLPDILRLAPNLQVYQVSPSDYVITARGFNGNSTDQAFANKLLVLIDGRSVYSPLFSGVYWDMQDVPPDDIERIEVISGPGATLWGANAVNGVINIITRKAAETQGGLLDVSAGNLAQSVGLRYGGTLDDDIAYRLYARDYFGDDTESLTGTLLHDHWSRPEGGFRLDWNATAADSVSLEGQDVAGSEAEPGASNQDIAGHNLVANWKHQWGDGSSLNVETYYDREERSTENNGGHFWVDTFDVDVQHDFDVNAWNAIGWGGGLRTSRYEIDGTTSLTFAPSSRTLNLADAFVQDSIAIVPSLTAILGLKLEDDPYSGLSPLPSARFSWKLADDALLWAAASRAIRAPTPFDDDVVEKVGSATLLSGNPEFLPETLTTYEVGARAEPDPRVSLSASVFYNDYSDLRSIELTPVTLLPLTWGNRLEGDTYGFEAWGNYQINPWWRLTAAYDHLTERFQFAPGATLPSLGTGQLEDDPGNTASLRSAMNLGADVTFDATLRYASDLPQPRVPAYVEFDADIGWNLSQTLRLALSGFNLLQARHQELPATEAYPVLRSFAVELQWRV